MTTQRRLRQGARIVDNPGVKLADAAAVLGVTSATLRQQIGHKRLRAYRLGRDWYVSDEELDRYRRESLGQPGPKPGTKRKRGKREKGGAS